MPDVAELLQQLERAEVAPPGQLLEDELWAALATQFEDRPWWQALIPSPAVRRTVFTGVALAGVLALLLAAGVWLAGRDAPLPPVIDQAPELDPLPDSLVGGTLPPFRATVHVRPSLDQSDVLVWEVSFDGEAGYRQELVDVRGDGGGAVFPIGSFVVSDGREIGRLDGLSTGPAGEPSFRTERASYPLVAPLSWDLSWGPYCDAPINDGDIVTCADWRGEELQIGRHPDSGLVTYMRGHLAELGVGDPFRHRAMRAITVGEEQGSGDPISDLLVVDVTWDPEFDEDTFAVSAPVGTTLYREDDGDEQHPSWSEQTGPPTAAFSLTVTDVRPEVAGPDGLGPRTWRFDHDPDRGWRAEAIANGDERWTPSVGSLQVSDGERLWFFDARSATYDQLPTSRPRIDLLQQVLAGYLDDVMTFEEIGDLRSHLASDACQQTGSEAVAGVPTSMYDCEADDVTDRLWVHDETALVLRRGRQFPGADMAIWHEVSDFALDPDLSELDVTFTPPPGSVSESSDDPAAALATGDAAPAWRSPLLAGGELGATDLDGQVTVVLFQSESCPISALQCRAFDLLLGLAEERSDVVTVWVPYEEFGPLPQRVADARGFTGHVLTDDGTTADGPIRAWGINGRVWDPQVPTVLWVVLDGDGRVVLMSDATLRGADLDAAVAEAAASR